MIPHIDQTSFGWITIDGENFNHDIVITANGSIVKRKKRLSKDIYGTSHTISQLEAESIFENGAEAVIIGSGQYGVAELSKEADLFFKTNHCQVNVLPTPQAIKAWNAAQGKVIGMFHVTC